MNPIPRRRFLVTTAAALAAPNILTSAKSGPPPEIVGHGTHRYRVERNWSKADHTKVPLRDCHEMIQSADERLFLLTNQVKNNILVYDTKGNLLNHYTHKMTAAHGLTLSRENGAEYLYVTCNSGRVIKTDLDGKVIMELPKPQEVGAYDEYSKYVPTETAVTPNGDIYVIDGYGSQFIIQYSREGKFIRKFGGRSSLPDNTGKFMQAHGIAIDLRGSEPLLVCTARIRNEFTWFTLKGEYLRSVYLPGAFVSRPVIKGDHLYSGVCFGYKENDYRMWKNRGFIVILDKDNKLVSCPGGAAPSYSADGKLLPLMKQGDLVTHGHDVCIDEQENLYLCQWSAGKVPPYKLHRIN